MSAAVDPPRSAYVTTGPTLECGCDSLGAEHATFRSASRMLFDCNDIAGARLGLARLYCPRQATVPVTSPAGFFASLWLATGTEELSACCPPRAPATLSPAGSPFTP